MTTIRSVALLVALAVGLTVAPLASGAVVSPLAEPAAGQSETNSTNASVGTLMQASAADAESSVETELFEVAYENADAERRTAIVTERTAELESRLADLEAERERLEAERENGTISTGTYRSRMAKLAVEIASLERSIERTARRANETGVGVDRLAALRDDATDARRNVSERAGPEVGAVARGLANGGGPPDHAGPPADGQSPGTDRGGQAAGPGSGEKPAAGADGKSPGNGSDAPVNGSGGEAPGNGSDDASPEKGPDGRPSGTSDPSSPDDGSGSADGDSGTGSADGADTDA